MALRNAVQLICYPNRIVSNLSDLIDRHLSMAVVGVRHPQVRLDFGKATTRHVDRNSRRELPIGC